MHSRLINNVLINSLIIFFSIFILNNTHNLNELLNFNHYQWFSSYGNSINQHLSGFYGLVYDKWNFPITITNSISFPNYSSIVLTDSLPIVAVITKLFYAYLPENFHYFGIWKILCIYLLCLSSFFLFYNYINKNIYLSFLFMLFSVSSYPLLSRTGNPTLNGHFIIFFSLIMYFEIKETGINKKKFILNNLVLIFSLLIHFYFFIFSLLIISSSYLQLWVDKRNNIKEIFYILSLTFIILLCIAYIFGFFYNLNGLGFDRFSVKGMPIQSLFFASKEFGFKTIFGNTNNVLFINEQYESLNYLGVGYILLLAICSFFFIKKYKYFKPSKNIFLFCSIFIIFIYSLGSNIYLSENINFTYDHHKIPYFSAITGILGVSGRMFIFCYVLISFFSINYLYKTTNKIIFFSLFTFISVLQYYEIIHLNYSKQDILNFEILESFRDNDYMNDLSRNKFYKENSLILENITNDIVFIIPPHQCSGSQISHLLYSNLVRSKKKVNSIWGGRDNYSCSKKKNDILNYQKAKKKKVSYVYIKKFQQQYVDLFSFDKKKCAEFENVYVCNN